MKLFSEIYYYYKGLISECGEGVPFKKDIRPQNLSPLLPWFVILELTNHNELLVRLAGTNIDLTLGEKLSDSNLLTKYNGEDQKKLINFFEKIKTSKSGGYFLQTMVGEGGKKFLNHYMLFPFCDNNKSIRYWAGILDFEVFNSSIVKIEKVFKPNSLEMTPIDIGFGIPDGEHFFDTNIFMTDN